MYMEAKELRGRTLMILPRSFLCFKKGESGENDNEVI